jgi:hypothetical protein
LQLLELWYYSSTSTFNPYSTQIEIIMANALKRLSDRFLSRQSNQTQGIKPNPGMLGTGLAANAATGLLMAQYRNQVAEAEANGESYPTFEEWMMQRQ